MSKPLVEIASDDEFEDALSDVNNEKGAETTSSKDKSNERVVEELLNELDLNANDDGAKREVFEDASSGAANDANDADDADESKEPEEPEEPEEEDDEIDEEALREADKLLTAEQTEINKEKANQMKLEANELFKNGNSDEAIKIYTKALKICPTTCPKERAILYGNRAAAKIQLDSKKSALEDCTMAIVLWPNYVRALLRRAKLYEHEDKLDCALEDYKRVNELDPGQKDALEACVRLPPIVNERNEKLKEEMMGKFKDLGNMILKPFGLSTSNFQMQQDPNTGSYSINFSQKP